MAARGATRRIARAGRTLATSAPMTSTTGPADQAQPIADEYTVGRRQIQKRPCARCGRGDRCNRGIRPQPDAVAGLRHRGEGIEYGLLLFEREILPIGQLLQPAVLASRDDRYRRSEIV